MTERSATFREQSVFVCVEGQHMNTQHLEEMGCKFGEALARLKARHMMRSLPLQCGVMMAAVSAATDPSLTHQTSTFVDEDFATYV